MPRIILLLAGAMACLSLGTETWAMPVSLGSAKNFAVLGGATVTNTGLTYLDGDLGVSPGIAITGFPPGTFTGTLHKNDAVAQHAHDDASTAYNKLEALTSTQDLSGHDLGGLTLTPGIYNFASSAQLTGILKLNGVGDYVFNITSTLTTASNSFVSFINGADPFNDVFWQVGSSATLGTNTIFGGTIIANQSATLNTGASVDGRVIALNAAVTLDNNRVTSVPEPATFLLLVLGGLTLLFCRRRVVLTTDISPAE